MEYLISMIIVFVLPSLYVLYTRKWLIKSAIKIGFIGFFIGFVWDYIAVHRGWWNFPNSQYLLGISFLGLPIEEFIFFTTCPIGVMCYYEFLIRKSKK
jgi:lycopene cyclase domain-containing protein